MPQIGHQISVYHTGTADLVDPIFTADSTGATLSNPFVIDNSWYGFEPPNNNRVDVYWHEGDKIILQDANVKDNFSKGMGFPGQVLTSQGPDLPTIWADNDGSGGSVDISGCVVGNIPPNQNIWTICGTFK